MSHNQRIRTGAFALLVLLVALAPALATLAAPGAPGPSIDDAPGIWSWVRPLWTSLTHWLSPPDSVDSVSVATEEDPPEEEDPFGGGGAGGGPGGGTGIHDPNGGGGT